MSNTIFVQIAAYRDQECGNTIKDLFAKAAHPELISVGLVWQYDPEIDSATPELPEQYRSQVRLKQFLKKDTLGCCWARAQVQQLYRDEKYTLQIDSHMRFEKNWDTMLIDMLKTLKAKGVQKPLISSYAPDWYKEGGVRNIAFKTFPILEYDRVVLRPRECFDTEMFMSAFICAHFVFVEATWIKEIPYDPYLYFMGEEINLSVRSWTNGWDIFGPSAVVLYHLYKTLTKEDGLHPNQNKEDALFQERNRFATRRLHYLFEMESNVENTYLPEIEQYSLGTVRSLKEYERFSGIDFKNRQFSKLTQKGLVTSAKLPCHEKVGPLSKGDSTVQDARYLNKSLGAFLEMIQAKTLLDIPCGDFNPIQCVDMPNIFYIGADSVESVIQDNQKKYGQGNARIFQLMNAIKDSLPRVDVLLCRDFFNHLPTALIWECLENFKKSGAEYLILTHTQLTKAPFYLPEPLWVIPGNDSCKNLGVWRLKDIEGYLDAVHEPIAKLRKEVLTAFEQGLFVLQTAFQAAPQLLKKLLQAHLSEEWQSANALRESAEMAPYITHGKVRDTSILIFRLMYGADLIDLQKQFPELTREQQFWMSVYVKEMLSVMVPNFKE